MLSLHMSCESINHAWHIVGSSTITMLSGSSCHANRPRWHQVHWPVNVWAYYAVAWLDHICWWTSHGTFILRAVLIDLLDDISYGQCMAYGSNIMEFRRISAPCMCMARNGIPRLLYWMWGSGFMPAPVTRSDIFGFFLRSLKELVYRELVNFFSHSCTADPPAV